MIAEGIAVMEEVARRCGYGLGEVFVEDDPVLRLGWSSLLAAVRVTRPVAVLVPDLPGSRVPEKELASLRARLWRETNAPLVLARPVVDEAIAVLGDEDGPWPVAGCGPVPATGARSRHGRGRPRRGWWVGRAARADDVS